MCVLAGGCDEVKKENVKKTQKNRERRGVVC
jgi:hypothetical protein